MEANNFASRFRQLVMLCSLAGIYIPGSSELFRFGKLDVLLVHCCIMTLMTAYNSVDWLILVIRKPDELGIILLMHMAVASCIYAWSAFNFFYMVSQRKLMKTIQDFWSDQLKPQLWPEIKEELLEIAYKKAKKRAYFILAFIAPYFLMGPYKNIMGELYLPSNLGDGMSLETNSMVSFLQTFSVVSLTAGIGMHQCWFSMILNLALVEVEYLSKILPIIVDHPTIMENGDIGTASYQVDFVTCQSTKENLISFVKYHSSLISFFHYMKRFYAPIVTCQFFFLTTVMCGLGYAATTGALPPNLTLISFAWLTIFSLIAMNSCMIGERMRNLGVSLGEICFSGSWMAYPIEIQKIILTIITASTQRELTIDFHGMFHLISSTFLEMTMLQYKFYTFMADTVKH